MRPGTDLREQYRRLCMVSARTTTANQEIRCVCVMRRNRGVDTFILIRDQLLTVMM